MTRTIQNNWRSIYSAPKDGTEIFIAGFYRGGAMRAYWGKYPNGDCFLSEDGSKVFAYGWNYYDWSLIKLGETSGFLGTAYDIENGLMPTHWCYPPFEEKADD